ncbi:DUF6708 domain-containing protein [Piscinibacter sp. HJYY11]|uniref:DUF6708 domain-containing protein n=1 Tax=Piscinibacter sp. HJYY11 TaxID=2801333 RepID=UPI00191F8FB4|nr:DUF6708 domain-containing protein [Piscinibacter sp. HJYY11]MBL0730558.1 hypothetical protein [Piscinibacter sp. HJYY11]
MSNPVKPHAVYVQDLLAAPQVTTNGWVRGVYQHAIEYTTFDRSVRGVPFLFGGVGIASLAFFAGGTSFSLFAESIADGGSLFSWATLIGTLLWTGAALFALIHYGRREFFRPLDLPIIFDRQRRKVYRLDQTPPRGVFSAFKPWPIRYVEHDWDDIVAEHGVVTFTTGSSVHRQHTLALMVRDKNPGEFKGEITPDNTPPYVDGFVFGDPKTLSELTTPRVWEHVRRYMNENGPALPPGEHLADTSVPMTWWDSLDAVSVFGPGHLKRWRERWGWMTIMHLLSPLMLPLAVLMATTNWLSYKTAYPVQWPQEVRHRIGPPMATGSV